jgi:cobalt/nickel transport system permease protein
VGLVLQAILFQFGGLTTLGVNTFAMAMPAVLTRYVFKGMVQRGRNAAFIAGFLGGASAIFVGALFVSISLVETERGFTAIAGTLLAIHVPIALIEGIITGFVVVYLKRVKPEVLG